VSKHGPRPASLTEHHQAANCADLLVLTPALGTHSDATIDAETAWALGFTPGTLTAEEEDLLPGDADEGVYCRVQHSHM
jgi:hypothetical protein